MKKILVFLLAAVMFCMSLTALAEGNAAVTLEVDADRLPVYAADDPYPDAFRSGEKQAEGETLPILLLPVKKNLQLRATVKPGTVKNKKTVLSAADESVAQVRGNTVTGLKPGETVLTVASEQDASVTVRYLAVVYRPVTRVSVTASAKQVAVGQTVSLTAAILPEDAAVKEVEWISADGQTAAVDENGTVTGMRRGNARITAVAKDGSNIRANISIQVIQDAEEITLDRQELTVDTGKSTVLKATVLPKDANKKDVAWSSSDESIAKVNAQGRVTGVAPGDCEITCRSKTAEGVWTKAFVHVQQPVKKIGFGAAPTVYVNETGKLTWTVEPVNATNQALRFKSGNEKILTVDEDGTVSGIKAGEAYVSAMSTDGSNRQARIKMRVYRHLTGVRMKRKTAYIDLKATSSAGAILEPESGTNHNMTWESADESIAKAKPIAKQGNRVNITGVRAGETVVTGTTEDGGFTTSITVKVGDWEKSLKLKDAYVEGADAYLTVKNAGELKITSITAEISVFDIDGNPVPCNKKDKKSNTYQMVYKKTLEPGASTKEKDWKVVNFKLPESTTVAEYVVKITEFEIDHDWIKVIRKQNQPTKKCPVHL